MHKLCQQPIWLVPGKSNSYCVREAGHEGEHNMEGNFEPAEQKKTSEPQTEPDRQ